LASSPPPDMTPAPTPILALTPSPPPDVTPEAVVTVLPTPVMTPTAEESRLQAELQELRERLQGTDGTRRETLGAEEEDLEQRIEEARRALARERARQDLMDRLG